MFIKLCLLYVIFVTSYFLYSLIDYTMAIDKSLYSILTIINLYITSNIIIFLLSYNVFDVNVLKIIDIEKFLLALLQILSNTNIVVIFVQIIMETYLFPLIIIELLQLIKNFLYFIVFVVPWFNIFYHFNTQEILLDIAL